MCGASRFTVYLYKHVVSGTCIMAPEHVYVLQYTHKMLAKTCGKPAVVRILLRHGSYATDRVEILGENLNCLEAAIEKGN